MSSGDLAIRVRDLGKSYTLQHHRARATTMAEAVARGLRRALRGEPNTREVFWALRNVGFEAARGEVVAVIGPNGAGKSTLLKILSRISEPTCGQVDLFGRVGSLLEVGTGFHTELTGRENIFLNGVILGMRRREIQRQFDAIVEFSGVEKFLDTPVKRYSSGMYVRLAFAVAAHLQNDILLVDEVLAVGDNQFQRKCLGKMQDVATAGRTVIFVSHNMGLVSGLCSRAIVLEQGTVVQSGEVRACIDYYLGQRRTDEATFATGPLKYVSVRQHEQCLALVARYECDLPVSLPNFGFVISDAMGQQITGGNPRVFDVPPLQTPATKGTVNAVLRSPRLLDGTYRLSVWFGDSQVDFISHRDCLTFQISGMAPPRQLEGAGAVFPECEWSFGEE